MRTKPKWGVPASYWIPEFKFDARLRRSIKSWLRAKPEDFYSALETTTGDFKAWIEYKVKESTPANVVAALGDVNSKCRKLADRLSENGGLDGRTRQYIQLYWEQRGMSGDVIQNCETALWNLCAAIELTRIGMKGKVARGRKFDPKQGFANDIAKVFVRFNIRPRPSRNSAFEHVLSALLETIGESISEDRIHSLAETASKLCGLEKVHKTVPLTT